MAREDQPSDLAKALRDLFGDSEVNIYTDSAAEFPVVSEAVWKQFFEDSTNHVQESRDAAWKIYKIICRSGCHSACSSARSSPKPTAMTSRRKRAAIIVFHCYALSPGVNTELNLLRRCQREDSTVIVLKDVDAAMDEPLIVHPTMSGPISITQLSQRSRGLPTSERSTGNG